AGQQRRISWRRRWSTWRWWWPTTIVSVESRSRQMEKKIEMFRSAGGVRTFLDDSLQLIAVATGIFTLILVTLQSALGASPTHKVFSSPPQAVRALINASKPN